MKKRIKEFALSLGVDDVGVAAAADYQSPRSPKLDTIFPGVKSIVVMAYKEPSSCESTNMQVAMSGRMDVMEFSRSCNYRMGRFLERECGATAMAAPASYPLEMSMETMGAIGDVSLRHAAIVAGLGVFGRHNLVIHPKLGTRVIFTAILTDLEIPSDIPYTEELCVHCDICVEKVSPGPLMKKKRPASENASATRSPMVSATVSASGQSSLMRHLRKRRKWLKAWISGACIRRSL